MRDVLEISESVSTRRLLAWVAAMVWIQSKLRPVK